MRIFFKNIHLENFMSYQDASLDLARPGYIMVKGTNECIEDNARSNGSGKSSIFSALSWCLTGQTISGAKEVANIFLDGTTSVTLEMDIDDVPYEITRTKNPSGLTIIIDGENKSGKGIRDSEKILTEYLPDLTYPLLTAVVVLGQGLPQRFTNNTPSGRKEVLETLSKSDFMVEDLKSRLASRKELLQTQLQTLTEQRVAASTERDIYNRTLEEIKPMLEEGYLEKKKEILGSLKHSADKEALVIKDNEEQLTVIKQELKSIEDEIDALQSSYIEGLSQLNLKDLDITRQVAAIGVEITSLEKEIKMLEADTGICPTCGQPLPNHEKVDTTEKRLHLDSLRKTKLSYESQEKEQEEYNNTLRENYKEKHEISMQKLNKSRDNYREDYEEINQVTLKLKQDSLDLSNTISQIENDIERYNQVFSKYNQLLTDINVIDKKLEAIQVDEAKVQNKLDINAKMSTLVKRDFRGYLLTNVIYYISNQAKEYALSIFGTDKIEFCLDGNNISISYDGKEYELLSGGEKQKVDLIIQLSIRDMLRVFLGFSSNILVLDEITDALDMEGSQRVFTMLSQKLTDVQSIYLISHHVDFQLPIDYEIQVVKGADKISRII